VFVWSQSFFGDYGINMKSIIALASFLALSAAQRNYIIAPDSGM